MLTANKKQTQEFVFVYKMDRTDYDPV